MTNDKNFEEWLKTFRESINNYDYYIDFKKVYENIKKHRNEIEILNSLIGSENIESDFIKIITKYPDCLKALPILLAIRDQKIYCQDESGLIEYEFNKNIQTIEQYVYFMKKTGLFDMIQNHIINNLYDYIIGIEVGLNSNGRKNRGGHQMEDLVESYIQKAGFIKDENYFKEMYLTDVEKKWDIDLSAISNDGTSTKRWDFIVYCNDKIYAFETNFYTSGGSKLNETARSYEALTLKSKDIKRFEFLWITDGVGWFSAKRNLEETFNIKRNIFNIKDMEDGLFEKIISLNKEANASL